MRPWRPFILPRRKSLSDIEYLAIKEFDGKLVENEGVQITTGDLATLTASSGKDMYLASAKLAVYQDADTGTRVGKVELKVNGVVKETFVYRTTGTGDLFTEYEFKNIGQKVAATQIIKLEVITNASNNLTIEGYIQCFEETTGESPQI